jgi:predicted membrane protein
MTADEPRVRVTTNLAFGICLILLGTTLILDRLEIVPAMQLLRFWPIAFVLFGVTLVIQSFQRPSAAPAARRQDTGLGPVIALVIFSAFMWNGFSHREITRADSSERTSVVALMSRHQQVSNAAVFRGAEMTTIMGRADLDLRTTTVAPGEEAVIHVFTVMGGSTIRVPEGWQVDLRATPVLGGARDRRRDKGGVAGAPRIIVRGFIMWGGLDIRS